MSVIGSGVTTTVAKIGYNNLFEDTTGTVTASTETAGYAKENAYDWRPYDWWKASAIGDSWVQIAFPSTRTVDYFAVAAHDLTTQGASIKLQYSTDSGSTWNDATTAASGVSNRVIFKSFSVITASYWRILVNAPTSVASIGVVAFGDRLDLPRGFPPGFSPVALARENTYQTSMSDNGQFIGRSVKRKMYKGAFELPQVSPTWVRNYWEPFIDHAETKPFFFSWDTSSHPDEAVLGWLDDSYTPPSYDSVVTMRIQLGFNARR